MADAFYIDQDYYDGRYYGYVADGSASVDSVATLAADVHIADTTGYFLEDYIAPGYFGAAVVEFSATLPVTVNSSISVTRLRVAIAAMSATSDLSVDSIRIRDYSSTFATNSTVNVTIGRIRSGNVNLNAAFAPTISVSIQKIGVALLESFVNLSVEGEAIFGGASLLEYFANLDSQADRLRDVNATLTSTTTASAQVGAIKQLTADLNATVTTSTQVGAIKQTAADLNVTSKFEFASIRLNLTSNTQLSVDVDRLRGANVNLSALSNVNVISNAAFDIASQLNVDTSFEVNTTVTADASVRLDSEATLLARAGKLTLAQSGLFVSTDVVADLTAIVVDKYVYTIPTEDRTFVLPNETRVSLVFEEDRTHIITGDS